MIDNVVAPFDEVRPARLVAAVGIVVACEQIAELVERQFLRVAESAVNDLQFGAVGIAAEDRTLIGMHELAAVVGGEVEPAITDAEVQLAVGTESQPVQVMPAGKATRTP